jgi:hypothetical protein
MFKVSAFDSFGNPTACDPLVLKLSALGPDNTGVAITAGREVTTGYATYVVDNKVEVELNDGSSGWINWETLTSNEPHVKVIINETN